VFEEHPEVIDSFKKHLYLRSIAEALTNIISFSGEELRGKKYVDERLKLLDSLFDMLKEDQDPEINSNIAFVISNILKKGAAMADNLILIQTLCSSKYVESLVTKLQTNVPSLLSFSVTIRSKVI
jgi:hypothetical protein